MTGSPDLVAVGLVALTLPTSGWNVHTAFGGFPASGSAFKEQLVDAPGVYTRTTAVAVCYHA